MSEPQGTQFIVPSDLEQMCDIDLHNLENCFHGVSTTMCDFNMTVDEELTFLEYIPAEQHLLQVPFAPLPSNIMLSRLR